MNQSDFDYRSAFSRNIGWVTETEQALLRGKRIAIAGLGGVGGSHLLTLVRLGVGAVHIADPDVFELANFNRQAGAMVSTLDRPKVETLAATAKDINPELDLRRFPTGITKDNLDEFLSGVDLYMDGLDFFVPEIRSLVFERCAERGIPAITAGPIGMGVAYLVFMPGGMSFEQYFRLAGLSREQQYVNFLLGLTPRAPHRLYLVDPERVNLAERRGPSTVMACELCAGVAATEAVKILLRRGPIHAAPYYHLFDAYRMRYWRGKLRWGNRGPLQTLKRHIGYRQLEKLMNQPVTEPELRPTTAIEEILDLARWAPSGDNVQNWRFEIIDDHRIIVHGFDTRDEVVYDLQGHASQLALGGLLETLEIAARGRGLECKISRHMDQPETRPTFDVVLHEAPVEPDPLEHVIRARCTQRRPMQRRPLGDRERHALEASVGEGYRVIWLEGKANLRRMAKLLFDNAKIRLTTPEAYPVHSSIIEWDAQFSADRIPDRAVGMDPVGLRLMRWALQSWRRVDFLNTYLGGTLLPRLQLDVLPALNCAAHFMIVAEQPLDTLDDYIAGGRVMQRFWLTATRLGLQFQPEQTPLIFASYVYHDIPFSAQQSSLQRARRLTRNLEALFGEPACRQGVYMGRVGFGPAPTARSLRLPLERLLVRADPVDSSTR